MIHTYTIIISNVYIYENVIIISIMFINLCLTIHYICFFGLIQIIIITMRKNTFGLESIQRIII